MLFRSAGSGTTYSPGIYSPGTDQLALATNGTHRLRIDSSGNLLVGTTSTSALATANRGLLELNGTNDCVYSYKASDSLLGYSLGTTSEIRLAAYAAIPLTFYTSNTERLRITSGGLVGIGTSSPSSTLHVVGSSYFTTGAQVGSGTDYASLIPGAVSFYNAAASNKWIKLVDDSSTINAIGFSKSGSAATVWFPSGNVGIGTTSPVTALDVAGEVSVAYNASYGLRFYNQDRTNWSSIGNNIATEIGRAHV